MLIRPARAVAALTATATVLALAACGSASDSDDAGAEPDGDSGASSFEPVTIDHAFGSTSIEEEPERVVTWGWATNDAVIALGTTPVAMPTQSYGGDEEGVLPWNREALEEAGEEIPTLLSEAEEPPYEEILAAEPDVILAQYSGITEEQYDKLAAIAPTVAYPEEAWATPWRDIITLTGEALGKTEEAATVLEEIDAEVAAAAEEHPEFEGRTIAAIADGDAFYVYKAADPRVAFLEDLGFEIAPSVGELDTGESSFFFTLSPENTDQLTSDVLLNYADTEEAQETFLGKPSTQALSQYDANSIALVTGQSLISSVSPPTALSATYGLDEVTEVLAEAVAGEGAGA
jgi:iron complex transport system substrate-binding protein